MILFMCKVLHEAGTAATQAERENGGIPWSDANAARIFGFYVVIPTALRTVFLYHILNMPNTPRVMTTARKQIQPHEHYIMVERLISMHKDERHNQGWSRYRHMGAATSSTYVRLLFLHTTLTRPRIHAITTTIPSSTATCLNSHDDTRSPTFHHPHSPYHAKPTCY